jgi:biotin carboxyl carrier protein
MIQIQVNESTPKSFSNEEILNVIETIDYSKLSNGNYSVIKNNKSYEVTVQSFNREDKTIELSINGKICTIKVADKMDLLLQQLGMGNVSSKKMNSLKAPMPGLVIEWFIQEGDIVSKGDKLLILEAMKMENVIKASGDGKVKKIHVLKGHAVEKNQLLIEFE